MKSWFFVQKIPGASRIDRYSQDSDVFFLCLQRFFELCIKLIAKGFWYQPHFFEKNQVFLDIDLSNALPGLHILSGAGMTDSFCGKKKHGEMLSMQWINALQIL